MLLLKSVELPDTCYVQEVAYWVAFGRVPEFMPYEDRGDVRLDLEAMLSGDGNGLDWYDDGFASVEFSSNGIDIDYERYIHGRIPDIDEYRRIREDLISRLEKMDWNRVRRAIPEAGSKGEEIEDLEEFKASHQKDLEEAEWARRMERLLKPTVNRAQAAVFQALASGELKSFGYVETDVLKAFLSDDDDRSPWPDYDKCLLRQEIPAHVWTLDDFDWRQSTLQTPDVTYTHVQVKTEDMLRSFPTPHCQSSPLTCEAFGGVVIAKDEDAPRASINKPGRPPRTYSVKAAIQNWFKAVVKEKPDYATGASETIIQDAIIFAQTYLGQEVPRSTIQHYLAPVLPSLPKTLPKNTPITPPKMEAAE